MAGPSDSTAMVALHKVLITLWVCQNSYWKLPFIVDVSIKMWVFSIALLVYKRVKYTKIMFMNQLLNQCAMTTTCSSMMKPYHVVQMFKSPPFCGSTTQFPCFFVADLYQEFSVFNMVQLLKYHWLKQSAYFFSIVQSIFSLVKTSHVPCHIPSMTCYHPLL